MRDIFLNQMKNYISQNIGNIVGVNERGDNFTVTSPNGVYLVIVRHYRSAKLPINVLPILGEIIKSESKHHKVIFITNSVVNDEKREFLSDSGRYHVNVLDGLDLLNNFLRQGYSTSTLHTGE